MDKRLFGCIGRRLSHSYSKEIHAFLGDYSYELYPLEPEDVGSFVRNPSLGGINVTIPYKKTVTEYLDFVDEAAKKVGAVNTVVSRDGRLFGYNTDVYGMKCCLARNGISLSGEKVLILGTGGTSLTAVAVAEELGAREIIRVSRTKSDTAVSYEEALRDHSDAGVIINTTPVGMYPDTVESTPVELSGFSCLKGVADVIYNPFRTRLVLEAQRLGLRSCGGLYMLVFQAVRAAELFTGQVISEETGENVYRRIYNSKCNTVLTGMPSSGKTTLGKEVAKRLNREFFDTDSMVEQREGMSVREIFEKHGEAYFRDVESMVIRSLESKTGVVIATGGGSILREENVLSLKSNGRLFFIDRELDELIPTRSRPLSSSREAVEKRYRERINTYISTADVTIKPTSRIEETASVIINSMNG